MAYVRMGVYYYYIFIFGFNVLNVELKIILIIRMIIIGEDNQGIIMLMQNQDIQMNLIGPKILQMMPIKLLFNRIITYHPNK